MPSKLFYGLVDSFFCFDFSFSLLSAKPFLLCNKMAFIAHGQVKSHYCPRAIIDHFYGSVKVYFTYQLADKLSFFTKIKKSMFCGLLLRKTAQAIMQLVVQLVNESFALPQS